MKCSCCGRTINTFTIQTEYWVWFDEEEDKDNLLDNSLCYSKKKAIQLAKYIINYPDKNDPPLVKVYVKKNKVKFYDNENAPDYDNIISEKIVWKWKRKELKK